MSNIIKHKRSNISGLVPSTGSIEQAELAINIFDGKLYTKNSSNSIINLGVTSISGTSITPDSGNFTNSLQVNGSGVSLIGHSHTSSDIINFNSSVNGLVNGIYAPLNSPLFTGIPIVPTAASGTNTNQIASTSFVKNEINNTITSIISIDGGSSTTLDQYIIIDGGSATTV
jgi:hypothetical protein